MKYSIPLLESIWFMHSLRINYQDFKFHGKNQKHPKLYFPLVQIETISIPMQYMHLSPKYIYEISKENGTLNVFAKIILLRYNISSLVCAPSPIDFSRWLPQTDYIPQIYKQCTLSKRRKFFFWSTLLLCCSWCHVLHESSLTVEHNFVDILYSCPLLLTLQGV